MLSAMQETSNVCHKEVIMRSLQEMNTLEGINYGSAKQVSTKFPYWALSCLTFIDSILGFVVSSVLSVIK